MHVTYRVEARPEAIEERAVGLAIEQSVECPMGAVRDARVRDEVVGQVLEITPVADACFDVRVALALETVGDDAAQLLNMVFGNSSLQPDVRVQAIGFPEGLPGLPGPQSGIAGVRERLGVPRGPLACSALKPQGLPTAGLASLAYQQALAGVDVIKDDHGLADPVSAPFAERVPAIQAAVDRANRETGGRSLYAPNLTGGDRKLRAQIEICRQHGVGAVLMCPLLLGASTMVEIVEDHPELVVLGHPAMAGVARIHPAVMYGTLFRLFGADMVIFPNFGGRFADDAVVCGHIAEAACAPMDGLAPAMPVPAGGLTADRVPELVEFYGPDVALLIGGSLLAADDPLAAMRSFVESVRKER